MKRIVSAASILWLLSSSTLAADFYIGARLGVADFDGVADTDTSFATDGGLPPELPIGGLPFDSRETAWSVHVGWQARSWLALELGHSDLGNSGFEPGLSVTTLREPAELPVPPSVFSNPNFVPIGEPLLGEGFVGTTIAGVGIPRPASLAARQWHLGARFSAPICRRLSGHWYLGLARTSFDVSGSAVLFSIDAGQSFMTTRTVVPNAEPGSETGVVWGFGFDWDISDRIAADLAWRRHETDVLDIDSMTLGINLRL